MKIAKKVNTAENCIQKAHTDMQVKHTSVVNWQERSAGSIQAIQHDIANIKELSDKIVDNVANVGNVINVYDAMAQDIDKIASNIHMISLNASIEAARAGEHGRSFAVVAEAIRFGVSGFAATGEKNEGAAVQRVPGVAAEIFNF